ncbi:hypothetical protein ACNANV_00500 [Curtobacterium flaccumfaciens pv. flaccumfaciens]|uniref:hypothetical protein n=1 Tax=Curtobacterium flaccumfaciens TaxID=2035 RepID=UPI003A4DA18C
MTSPLEATSTGKLCTLVLPLIKMIALGQVAYWSTRIDTTLPLLAAALIRASDRPRTRKQAEVVGLTFSQILEKTSALVAELDAADQVRVLFERDASAFQKAMEDRNHLLHAYWLRGPREPAMAPRTRGEGTTTTPFCAADVKRVAVDLASLSDRVWLIYAVADGILEYQHRVRVGVVDQEVGHRQLATVRRCHVLIAGVAGLLLVDCQDVERVPGLKSEHKVDGIIGVTDTLQVNGHLALVAQDRNVGVPALSAAVMVSPRAVVHKDAIAVSAADSYRVTPEAMRLLAIDAERMWTSMQVLSRIKIPSERIDGIAELLEQSRLRPEDVFDRLTTTRIGEV